MTQGPVVGVDPVKYFFDASSGCTHVTFKLSNGTSISTTSGHIEITDPITHSRETNLITNNSYMLPYESAKSDEKSSRLFYEITSDYKC